ncbi:MAG: hypothetical protein OHK0029_26750 [Armatimonadaceae bacterium]
MEIYVQGKQVTLSAREFAGQGGEGSVYIRQGTAYKVYADPAKAVPAAKIRELGALTDPAIIKPEEELTDAQGRTIGYTMRAVENAVPLCQMFPRSFRDRYRVTPDKTRHIVQQLQERIQATHAAGILVVDVNEMNFLLSLDLTTVFAIDVAGYQTRSFPATAIMESVRDRHRVTFSPETDWFSFAVLAFQIFIGIHPYRGKHPTWTTLDDRMQANVSALNPEVTLPPVCQPLATIPTAYRDWFQAVLEEGERVPPPAQAGSSFVAVPVPGKPTGSATRATPTMAGTLQSRLRATLDGVVLDVVGEAVLTTEAVYVASRKIGKTPAGKRVHLVVAPTGTVLLAWQEDGRLCLWNPRQKQDVPITARVDDLQSADGRLYARCGGNLVEIVLVEAGNRVFAQPRVVGIVHERTTRLFPGAALQNLLGACYVSLLPEAGVCQQVRIPELDAYRVIDGKFQGGVLVVVGQQQGQFCRWVFRFDQNRRTYDAQCTDDVSVGDINFVVLGTGICLLLTSDGGGNQLAIFEADYKAGTVRGTPHLLTDPLLAGAVRLYRNGSQAQLALENHLYEIGMK